MIITYSQVVIFFLILSRFIGVFLLAPIFSNKQFMVAAKFALVFWASGLLIFSVPLPPAIPSYGVPLFLALISELLIGVCIGFITDVLIVGIEMSGALMDTQAGLSVASLLDPSTGRNAALFEIGLRWISIIIFLVIDGHHMILSVLHYSLKLIPPGMPFSFVSGVQYLFSFGADIFFIGV